ncbi:Fructosamine kinase-domain-containing protein [Lophiotrema nucula]|uniref:protein-ribulosamine 3-kinase n=1 Tax=Lophiotrema nucula TaxID=690887 RepID=A0A6A5YEU3_9PLEO|nr:Fructosamine kinase-domain-containing protein [Lophiotrema nucula]
MSGLTGMPPPKKQDMFEVVEIDDSVAACFPEGALVIEAWPHGASFWARTARVEVNLADGRPHTYFLKVATGDVGKGMSRGEFEGMSALAKVVPEGVPMPVAWGTYKSNTDTHFYLADFVDMLEDLPDVQKFCSMLAKLHRDSMALSPNGKFGFPVTTYEGTMYQDVTWCDTWEESFALHMKAFVDQERQVHGSDPELEALVVPMFERVIPRLLRPLHMNGRSIKPALVHGDVWYGNIATIAENGEPIMFDPSVFWGHNEYDLDNMKVPRYRMGRHWMREYHKHFPISAPEDDYEDRINLYEIRGHLCASTLYPHTVVFHRLVIDEMRKLVAKFPNGYQGQ